MPICSNLETVICKKLKRDSNGNRGKGIENGGQ